VCHGTSTRHTLHGYRRPVKRCEQPDRLVATRVRGRGRTGRLEGLLASLTPGSAHCTGKPRGSGWDSGRTKLPNPRAPPTPSDADRGGGWERVRRDCRAGGSLEAAAQSKRYLVPLLLTGVSLHPPAPKGGPTRTSADASVPRLAGFSLIT
jgi:hypothetical protein